MRVKFGSQTEDWILDILRKQSKLQGRHLEWFITNALADYIVRNGYAEMREDVKSAFQDCLAENEEKYRLLAKKDG